jgi:hypothetical protein
MATFGRDGLPAYGRLPREARHVVRTMLHRRPSYHRASVLLAQVDTLHAALFPGHEHPDRSRATLGQRVRLGPEGMDLLRRLREARSLHVQRQLARELRAHVLHRVRLHARRSRNIAVARGIGRAAGRWTWSRSRGGWERLPRPRRASRERPSGPQRDRAPGRSPVPPRARGRFEHPRSARSRARRRAARPGRSRARRRAA